MELPRLILPVVDGGLLVLIWLVQLILYPGLSAIEAARFNQVHARYMATMTWIVGPLMVAQLVLSALECLKQTDSLHLLLFALVVLTWVSTAVLSVPLHQRLQKAGPDERTLRRLTLTNWPRTALWSAIPLLRLTALA